MSTERERFLAALLDSAADYAIFATDLDGRVTSWNTGAENLLGLTRDEITGRPAAILFTPEDRAAQKPEQEMRAALAAGRGNDERWHVKKDGSIFWASGELLPLKDDAQTPIGFVKILRDRTEAVRTAESHRADAEFLRSILAASADCLKVLDLEGRLTFMSEQGKVMMHVDDFAKIAGCPWADFWEGKTNLDVRAAIATALAGGVGHFQGEAATLKGVRKYWDVQVTPIPGPDGKPEKLLAVSRDITAARDNELKILRLAAVVEQSNDFIGISDIDGRILFANRAGLTMLGLPALDAAAKAIPPTEFFAAQERQRLEHSIWPALQQHGCWSGEVNLRNVTTGAAVPVLYSVYRLTDAAGETTGYGSIARDQTEDRRAARRRAALADLTEHLRDMTDAAEMARTAARIVGETLGVIRAGYATLKPDGVTAVVESDWAAPGISSVAGLHNMRDYGSYVNDLLAGETVVVDDVLTDPRTEGGSSGLGIHGIRAIINAPLLESGKLVAFFYVNHPEPRAWTPAERIFIANALDRTRNATERRRAEDRLHVLAASLEQQVAARTAERDQIWQVSQDLLAVADAGGVLVSMNPAWTNLLGWRDDELLGRTTEWLSPPEDHARIAAELQSLGAGKTTAAFECRIRTKAGDYRDFSWTAVPSGGMLYAMGRDVTEQKLREAALHKAEEQLRQSQKMEALGQLTGGIAHDFNNLLTGIIGALDIVKRRLAANRPGDVLKFMDAASTSAQRAAALTHRLLAFARRQSLDTKPSDINRLVGGMEELLRRTIGEHVALQTALADDLWPALTDDNQLENAILNLAINARDAMQDGGKLTIETANAVLDEMYARVNDDVTPGAYVAISVTDTGTGMPASVVAKAFDPFFTTKPIGEGTGLGLSMIYGFVKQCAGHVRIYSEEGAGTTVKIYLPRAVAQAESEADQATEPPLGRGETVLVVEDDPTVRLLMTDVLNELGYRYFEAADGKEAVPILRSRQRIDLLLTDVGLPNMNGRQLAEIARAQRPGLRVLFVTGYAEKAAVRHGFLEPGMEMMTKPFAMDALATKVREMIER